MPRKRAKSKLPPNRRSSSLPRFIARLQLHAGLTDEQVAQGVGGTCTRKTIGDYKQGRRTPSWRRLAAILGAMNAHDYLLGAACLRIATIHKKDFFYLTGEHKAFVVFSFLRQIVHMQAIDGDDWQEYRSRIRFHAESFGNVIDVSSDDCLRIYDFCMSSVDPTEAEANIVAGSFTLQLERWFAGVTGGRGVDFADIFR